LIAARLVDDDLFHEGMITNRQALCYCKWGLLFRLYARISSAIIFYAAHRGQGPLLHGGWF
jgi:hypothetical protein